MRVILDQHFIRWQSIAFSSPRQFPSEYALWGLLHDASEAYLTDIPRPIKPYLSSYKEFETPLDGVYCRTVWVSRVRTS